MQKTGPPGLPCKGGPVAACVRYRPKLRNTGRESLKDLAELKAPETKGVRSPCLRQYAAPLEKRKGKTGCYRPWVKMAALVLFSSA